MKNYWQRLHMSRVGNDPVEIAAAEAYEGEPSMRCPKCGGDAPYRMTVGRHMCPGCRWIDRG